jgi:acetyl-CoA acetyltransferase
MKEAFLVTGVRTPFAKAGTELKDVHATELGRHALSELIARLNVPTQELGRIVDEVIIGNTARAS